MRLPVNYCASGCRLSITKRAIIGLEEHLISIKLFVSRKLRPEIRRGRLILRARGVGDPPPISAEGHLLEKSPLVSETTPVLENAFARPKSGMAEPPPSSSPAPSPRKRRQAGQPAADAPLLAPGSAQGHSQAHTRTQSTYRGLHEMRMHTCPWKHGGHGFYKQCE